MGPRDCEFLESRDSSLQSCIPSHKVTFCSAKSWYKERAQHKFASQQLRLCRGSRGTQREWAACQLERRSCIRDKCMFERLPVFAFIYRESSGIFPITPFRKGFESWRKIRVCSHQQGKKPVVVIYGCFNNQAMVGLGGGKGESRLMSSIFNSIAQLLSTKKAGAPLLQAPLWQNVPL